MFQQLTEFVTPLMETYGVAGVFIASIIEEIIAPIPSSVVVLSAGFLLTNGSTFEQAVQIVALKVMIPAALGISTGSLFPYYIARIGGKIAIDKFGWLLGVKSTALVRGESWFQSHRSDELLLFIVRTIPVIPSVIIGLFCGFIRIPVGEFLLYTFLGSLIRTFMLGMIGWFAGKAYITYADQINKVEDIVLVLSVFVLGAFIWLFLHKGVKKIRSKAAGNGA